MEKTPINGKSQPPQSLAPETEVTGDMPSSNSRKGKRQLDAGTDLQPVPKKSYNLRSRKSNFSEEEVSAKVPTTNRRTGKRLAESDSDLQASSKKPYSPQNKIFSISDDEGSQEVKQCIDKGIEDTKQTGEVNKTISTEEAKRDLEVKQCIDKGIEDMKQTGEVNKTISTEEAKRDLGSQEVKQCIDKGIEDMKQTGEVNKTISTEEAKRDLGSQEEKQSFDQGVEDMKEIVKLSTTIAVEELQGDLGSQEGKQSINEGTEDRKETVELNATIAIKEAKGELEGKQSIGENIEDMKESVEGCRKEDSMDEKVESVRETLDMSSEHVEKIEEELGSQKGKESINEDIDDVKETVEVNTTIATKEAMEHLGSQEGRESINEDIDDVKETVEVKTTIGIEETGEDLGCQKEDSMDEKVECVRQTVDMSSSALEEKVEVELGSQEGKENINEDIADMKETVEVNTKIAIEEAMGDWGCQKEDSVDEKLESVRETLDTSSSAHAKIEGELEGKDSINEDIANIKETVDVNTKIAIKEAMGDLIQGEDVSEKEKEDTVDSWELSSSRCTVDSQEETEDEVVYVKENSEAKDEQSSSPVVPKTSLPTRSKIVFVGNLPYSIRRNSVVKFFEDIGSVVDIRMPKNADGSTKGFCHVTFATYAAALKALEKNGEMLCNRSVKLDLAEDLRNRHLLERTVLVRGLQRNQRENDIRKSLLKHFEDCGGIKKVHVPKDIQSGDSTRVAFIQFEDSEAVPKAVELCGSELGNCKLFVKEVSRSRFRR